ncbi:hypothetical protein GCK72_007676 [Caenorhabditis remanei]|uniref:C2H2-type domain-containing protein n=1 Tax=Caenorhabditis remanei TaxID=31234 RepID=A0A6A5HN01_CAERE|nr:hypothetical protein GCK72_007676 [Caenorhabditis remanei]KAF1767717.1 hypothetical protein GCK72_007676 [Caenorhabditis remanei]
MTDPAKRHECNVCHKTFKTPSALVVHAVIHTGEKPFECDDCGMKYNSKATLSKHRLIHETSKPFECLICGKADTLKYNIKRHINKVHNLEGDRLEAAIQSSERRRNIRKSARTVLNKTNTVSTPNTKRKAPKRSRQEEEDMEAMDDDNDLENSSGTPAVQQREIDSDSVIPSNRRNALGTQETGNHRNSDEVNKKSESNQEKTEEKPSLILAPLPKRRKINTPTIKMTPFPIKTENPIVQEVGDLMPLMDLSTSSFHPSASQQGILDMGLDSQIGSVSNNSSINTPQFSFDEDIRQIAHQLSRVATARPECHDALREVLYGTIVAFGSGGFDNNVGEFFKKMNDRYNH